MSTKPWVRSLVHLQEFISYVIVYAPDAFPEEDYLGPDEQMSLNKAFVEMRRGVEFVRTKISDEAVLAHLEGLLEESLEAYEDGDDVKGAKLLQVFEDQIFS
ncbi:MAG: hypothetical protein KDC35_01450 [Acidobacteria bacterium]|nr:hypothetical protein [Acidobacteriota bacterium]